MKSFLYGLRVALPFIGIVVFAYLGTTIAKLDERLLIATEQSKQKARGASVTYDQIPSATHATVALDASGALITWLRGLTR